MKGLLSLQTTASFCFLANIFHIAGWSCKKWHHVSILWGQCCASIVRVSWKYRESIVRVSCTSGVSWEYRESIVKVSWEYRESTGTKLGTLRLKQKHPINTSCVASIMCAPARNVVIPPHPNSKILQERCPGCRAQRQRDRAKFTTKGFTNIGKNYHSKWRWQKTCNFTTTRGVARTLFCVTPSTNGACFFPKPCFCFTPGKTVGFQNFNWKWFPLWVEVSFTATKLLG